MKTKKRKLNKLAIRRCIIVFLIIIIFLILISTIINKNKNKYKELTILLNNELLETTKEVIIEDNNIFFSKEDIKTIFDDTIYYNEAEKELITTYNTHVALLKVDEQYALINVRRAWSGLKCISAQGWAASTPPRQALRGALRFASAAAVTKPSLKTKFVKF